MIRNSGRSGGLMDRREFITLLSSAAVAWPSATRAEQPPVPVLGLLGSSAAPAQSEWTAAFLQRLRELGWSEGRNIIIDYRWGEGHPEARPASFPKASSRSPGASKGHSNSCAYWSSLRAAVVGSYYGKLMARAEQDRRIAPVPYDPAALVWTSWDLGIRHATAIWFAQVIGREIRIIDYYEASGVDLGHYVRESAARPLHLCRAHRAARCPGEGARHRQEPARGAGKLGAEEHQHRPAAPGGGRHQRGARVPAEVLVRREEMRARDRCAQALPRRI